MRCLFIVVWSRFACAVMALVSIRYCRKTRTVFAVVILFGIAREVTPAGVDGLVQPTFAEPIPNVTVSAGRDVSLPCAIDNLGSYRVAWTHKEKNTLLSIQTRVIIKNSRYKVSHNNHRTWYLHIANVREKDSGQYMCQINTSPMISQMGYLSVVIPPYIDEEATSSDADFREGTDANLKCVAKGSPNPQTKWRREDGQDIAQGKERVHVVHGNLLNLTKVSRLHMGAYLCIASNGIPPSVSKRILLNVNFPPMVWIPNQLVGASTGSDVTLDCNLESYPQSVTFWTKASGSIIGSGHDHDSVLIETGHYKVQMQLRLRNVQSRDFGTYTCVAKNSLGETEGTIRLYEIPSAETTISQSEPPRGKPEKLQKNRQFSNELSNMEEPDLDGSDNGQTTGAAVNSDNSIDKGSMETGRNGSPYIRLDTALLPSALLALFCFCSRFVDGRTS